MQALVDFIVRNLMALWPIARIYEWDHGVMLRCGKVNRKLTPGLHWRWLFIEEIRRYPCQECIIDLPVGSVTSADGVTITVSANIGYRVDDYATLLLAVWSTEASIKATAIGFLTSSVAQRQSTELLRDRAALEASLLRALGDVVRPWGVRVTRVYLTDLVIARQYRLFGDPRPVV